MPERDERENENARDENVFRPSKRNVDVPIRSLSDRESDAWQYNYLTIQRL